MRILITNDDGYTSPGITLLAKALRENGHRVFVVAPDKNRSGCSHSIEFLLEPVKFIETEKDTWSCSGTPADCVISGLLGGIKELDITTEDGELILEKAPDLVLSGINRGANLGTDIIYSGTAAGARQGSFFGIPSIALSLIENEGLWHWEPAISFFIEKLSEFIGFWKENTFVNVNFPNNGIKPSAIVPALPSVRHYKDRIIPFTAPNGSMYCFVRSFKVKKGIQDVTSGLLRSDWSEVTKNNAAVSVIMSQPALAGGFPDG